MTTWDRQTRAFLEHLGIPQPDRELPEPISAEWTRKDERTERMMFDVGTFEPFAHYDTRSVFDGEETYGPDQLTDDDIGCLADMGSVEIVHDGRRNTVTVKRRNVTPDRLPRYAKSDIVAGARGPGRFRYRNGR